MGMLSDNLDQQPAPQQPAPQQPEQQPAPMQTGQEPVQGDPMQDFQALKDQATQFVYGDRFEPMLEMFRTNGAQKFPHSMAVAVNGVLTDLKKKNQMSHEMAAAVGMDVFLKILQDVSTGTIEGQPVVEGLDMNQVEPALQATIDMYVQSNPDLTEQDKQALYQELQTKTQGGGQMAAEPAPTGAQPAPEDMNNAGIT